MINLALLLPLALGVTVVTQATLNRSIGLNIGLATAVLINAAVFFVLSLGFFLIAKYTPTIVPEFLQVRTAQEAYSWSYLIPGLCGFLLVLGLPWSIQNIGPSSSYLLLIASQVAVSLGVEAWQAGAWPSMVRMGGALLILIGSIFVIKS